MMKTPRKRGYLLMKDDQIKAVHDDDLTSLLKALGNYERVCNGQCNCFFCNNIIKMENIGAIFPHQGEILFSCDLPSCLRKLVRTEAENGDT